MSAKEKFERHSSKLPKFFKSTGGFTLIEVIMVSGLMLLAGVAFTQMLSQQQKQLNIMSEKSEALQLQNMISQIFGDSSKCLAQLKTQNASPTLDVTGINPSTESTVKPIELTELHESDTSSAQIAKRGEKPDAFSSKAIKVKSIKITRFKGSAPTANQYLGHLIVDLEGTTMAIKPISVALTLTVSAGPDNTARPIIGCNSGAVGQAGSGQATGAFGTSSSTISGTNTSKAPLFLSAAGPQQKRVSCQIMVDGLTVGYGKKDSNMDSFTVAAMVPAGKSYQMDCGSSQYNYSMVPLDPNPPEDLLKVFIGIKTYKNCTTDPLDPCKDNCQDTTYTSYANGTSGASTPGESYWVGNNTCNQTSPASTVVN
jgi:type II secretory pathway pseudopilin PulG